jgi:hypothetical protein
LELFAFFLAKVYRPNIHITDVTPKVRPRFDQLKRELGRKHANISETETL